MRRLFLLIFSVFSVVFVYAQLPYSESFETDFGIWTQSTTDNFDWSRISGATPDAGTGPSVASDGSYYLYIEATGHNDPPQTAIIEAPFDFSGSTMPILSFDYHMYGQGIGFLSLWVFDGSIWTEVWNQLNEVGNQWNNVKICLGDYADNANVKIRFKAETQYSDSSDIAIDNIDIVDFSYTNVVKSDVTCGGYSDGSIDITIAGGFGSYEYSINDGIDYTPDAATSHLFSGLPGGDYPLKVKDVSGCIIPGVVVNLLEPTIPDISTDKNDVYPCVDSKNGDITITATGLFSPFTYSISGFGGPFQVSNVFSSLDTGNYQIAVKNSNGCIALGTVIDINCPTEIKIFDESTTDVSTCFGDCNGAVSVTAGGGNGQLSFAIDTSASLVFESSSYFSDLCAGSYRLIVEDVSGCRDTSNYMTVDQPLLLSYTGINHTDVTGCFGDENGTITLSATGGTGTISYSIDNGTNYQTSGDFSDLASGDYNLWIRDQHNCLADGGSITITEPTLLVMDSVLYADVTGCYGNSNAEIHIYASGGTSPLNYSIDGSNYFASRDFVGLDVGDYYPYVSDNNGCKDSSSTINIIQPSLLQITNINAYDVDDCYGNNSGSIQIFASQGTEPYEYSIDGGSNYQSIFTFSTVSAGTYQIVVRDANGCVKFLDSLVTINQPSAIVISSEIASDVSCNGSDDGTVYVDANGGTGALLYSVDNGLTFPYSVGALTYLAASSYQIVVKDENNCKVNGSLLTINEPDSLLIDSIISVDVDGCYGDSAGVITIYAHGGTLPLNYSIDNGFVFQSSSIFDSLPSQTGYLPFVKDNNGCFVLGNQQTIGQPPQLIVISQSHTNIDTCHGVPVGTLSISSNGGTGTIYYSVDNGSNYYDNSGDFSNLYAGIYDIKIKDSKNCIASGWQEEIFQPDTFLIDSIYTENVRCSGLGNGKIYIYSSGGQPQINYSVNGGLSYQVSSQFINLTPGSYDIILKDNYNCQVTSSTSITEPPPLVLDSVNYTNVNTCNGDSTGTISVFGYGGVPDLEYAYCSVSSTPSDFYATSVFNNVNAGSYYVTLKDKNGCTETSSSFSVTEPSIIQISDFQTTNVTCFGLSNGTIDVNVVGGTPGYEYSINDGLTWAKNNGHFTGLNANTYKITARDTNMCQVKYSESAYITEPTQLKIDDLQHYDPACNGYTDGKIIVFPTGGTGPYSYTLADTLTQTVATFNNLPEGKYWITLTDNNNCVAQSDTVDLIMPINLALFTADVTSGCSPLEVQFNPDSILAVFSWDFGDSIQSAWLSPGHTFYNTTESTIDFIVTAVAEHSVCSDTSRQTITVYSQPNVFFDVDNSTHYYPDTNVVFSNITSSYTNYHWDFGDNTTFDAMDPVSHSYPICGIYDISLVAQNGFNCWDTAYQSVNLTSVDPDANFIMDQNEGCEPLTVNFTNTSASAIRYEWIYDDQVFSSDTNPTIDFDNSSNYLVKLNAYGYCDKKDSISQIVYVYPTPDLDFLVSPDTVAVGQEVLYQNYSTGAAYYIWNFGDNTYSGDDSPRRSYSIPGTFSVTLKGISVNGCSDSLTLDDIIFVSSDFFFKLPNAFSPDGDGINDYFKPLYNMVESCRIEVYSRRGQLLFRTDDFGNVFWDGTFNGHRLPIDSYVWEIYGKYLSGEYFHELGSVTIVR